MKRLALASSLTALIILGVSASTPKADDATSVNTATAQHETATVRALSETENRVIKTIVQLQREKAYEARQRATEQQQLQDFYDFTVYTQAVEAELERRHQAQHAAEEAAKRAAAAKATTTTKTSSSAVSSSVWDRLAQCESGGNWQINTGNGYYGGLQFNLSTWQAYGGTGYPHQHSRETQIAVAERLRAARGFQPWPACSKALGLR